MRRVVGLRNLVILSIARSVARASAADTLPALAFALDQQCFSPEALLVKANAPFDLIITTPYPARPGQAALGTWEELWAGHGRLRGELEGARSGWRCQKAVCISFYVAAVVKPLFPFFSFPRSFL
jgi:hypothetical protein